MKRLIVIGAALMAFALAAAPAMAGGHQEKGEKGERGYSDSAPQPDKAKRVRKGHDMQPRDGKPKPKPKPKPQKESGEKGGTEDINIGIGELQE